MMNIQHDRLCLRCCYIPFMLILQPGRSSLSNLRCLHDDDAMMYLAALQCAAKLVCYTMYAIIHIMLMVCCMQYLWPSIPHRDTNLWRSIQHCDKIQQVRLSLQLQASVVLCHATCTAACRSPTLQRCFLVVWKLA